MLQICGVKYSLFQCLEAYDHSKFLPLTPYQQDAQKASPGARTYLVRHGLITVNPCYHGTLKERHHEDDSAPGVVIEQLEDVHPTLGV